MSQSHQPTVLPRTHLADQNEAELRNAPGGYPRFVYFLFLALALYIAVPLADVPLLGLSLSAPIFFLVALNIFLRPAKPWFSAYRSWIVAAGTIMLGVVVSSIGNGLLSQGTQIDRGGLVALAQYGYWLLVFVCTTYFVSSEGLGSRTAGILAVGVALLAGLRVAEALLGDAIGAWTHPMVMSQNNYAIQFSTFGTVLLAFVFFGKRRLLAALAVIGLWGAVLMNGSRGGWLAGLCGVAAFVFMQMLTRRRRIGALTVLFLLIGILRAGSLMAPERVVSAFQARFATFQRLDQDKSYAIRQLMDQKGLKLFRSSPLLGVGISRWRKESIPLEIPRILQYAGQEYFNQKSSHNSYIQFLAENGLSGALPLGILLLVLIVRGFRAASRLASGGEVWALGLYVGFLGMSLHLWVLSGLSGTLPWFMYGLVAGLIELDRRRVPDAS